MRFEWDPRKDRKNQRNHDGISFELAMRVFNDDDCIIEVDSVDETGEQRWYALGSYLAAPNVPALLFVIHVYREGPDGQEITRIISARAAEKHEFRRYKRQAIN